MADEQLAWRHHLADGRLIRVMEEWTPPFPASFSTIPTASSSQLPSPPSSTRSGGISFRTFRLTGLRYDVHGIVKTAVLRFSKVIFSGGDLCVVLRGEMSAVKLLRLLRHQARTGAYERWKRRHINN